MEVTKKHFVSIVVLAFVVGFGIGWKKGWNTRIRAEKAANKILKGK